MPEKTKVVLLHQPKMPTSQVRIGDVVVDVVSASLVQMDGDVCVSMVVKSVEVSSDVLPVSDTTAESGATGTAAAA